MHRSEFHYAWSHEEADNELTSPEVKSQTGLSSLRVSCKCALSNRHWTLPFDNLKTKTLYILDPLTQHTNQWVIFKSLSYCFKEPIEFDLKASFPSRPVSRLIKWYNRPGDTTRWYNEIILRKGYSIPRDFLWIENYKLQCRFSKYARIRVFTDPHSAV